ncbi:MAG: deoxyguanosinetriphosphate triphosphohydrolase [Hyphomicrobiaceae bacterium]
MTTSRTEQISGWQPAARPVAAYAVPALGAGQRLHSEAPCPMRTPFQRDRDRIVHATAFRRLNYKTQVFLFHEGDHYRSRLTHSLEVAQIARSMARMLGLDEDLAEALALAHDLGHPPFGHAGERALDRALKDFGGFDHNAQSLRVVTRLERKYARFDGLNLTFETLDGLVKHNGPVTGTHAQDGPEARAVAHAVAEAGLAGHLDLATFGSAEAQVAALADDIAWHNHDIDDGLRAGLLAIEDLADVPLAGAFVRDVLAQTGNSDRRRAIYEVNRRMITVMIADCVGEARQRLGRMQAQSSADVRLAGEPTVVFSRETVDDLKGLKAFLFSRVYRHPRVMAVMTAAEGLLIELLERYRSDASSLPGDRADEIGRLAEPDRSRRICDFVAGMTDRFAIAEHRRLFDATPDLG